MLVRIGVVRLAVLVAFVAMPAAIAARVASTWPPTLLRDTGLYSDWDSKIVRRGVMPFAPQYPLWSDGAAKSRWISVPNGTWIDASDPDAWKFPVGTRLWKEFRFGGRRVETRLIEHTRAGWRYATYAWNDDASEATLVSESGISNSVEIRPGVRHAIPSRTDCRACHEAGLVPVLGFSALQLSADRDPQAVHAEAVPLGGIDLDTLIERGIVRRLPPRLAATPPRIDAPTPAARAALGYLHANCGTCHNAKGALGSLQFSLFYTLNRTPGQRAPAFETAVGQASRFHVAGQPETGERVRAGDPDHSVLVSRMSSRYPVLQMPPLGTRIVDEEAVRLIRAWIAEQAGGPQ